MTQAHSMIEERTMTQAHSIAVESMPRVARATPGRGDRPLAMQLQFSPATIALTPAGRTSLERELAQLRDERLPALIAYLAEARDDPSSRKEGEGSLEVQHEQHRMQRRIAELEWLLEMAREITPPADGVISLGSRVEIEDEGERDVFQLVDPREAHVAEGRLSVISPVGRALLGHAKGDQVVVETPAGERRLRVVTVS